MSPAKFKTPILLITFNRPDYVEKQLKLMRRVRPAALFIANDAPRIGNETDQVACKEIRDLISLAKKELPIKTLFRKKNEGCRYGEAAAMTWFFSQVPEGIVLEDDCFPDESFFPFCSELLKKYRHNVEVWQIAGSNFSPKVKLDSSYFFSKHINCWGWAGWRRSWEKYDADMKDWPQHREQVLSHLPSEKSRQYWDSLFERTYNHQIDTWDYQWVYTIWKHKGISIIPKSNLVTNIGFDSRATHTKLSIAPSAYKPVTPMEFPLVHPTSLKPDSQVDKLMQNLSEEHLVIKVLRGIHNLISIKLGLS